MKKTKVRCWKALAKCSDGTQQMVLFTIPDFGDVPQLFTCARCGALFAVDPDQEFYTQRSFAGEKQKLQCPECSTSLGAALPYPANFHCESTGQLDRYERTERTIPSDKDSVVVEIWNPLS